MEGFFNFANKRDDQGASGVRYASPAPDLKNHNTKGKQFMDNKSRGVDQKSPDKQLSDWITGSKSDNTAAFMKSDTFRNNVPDDSSNYGFGYKI